MRAEWKPSNPSDPTQVAFAIIVNHCITTVELTEDYKPYYLDTSDSWASKTIHLQAFDGKVPVHGGRNLNFSNGSYSDPYDAETDGL